MLDGQVAHYLGGEESEHRWGLEQVGVQAAKSLDTRAQGPVGLNKTIQK